MSKEFLEAEMKLFAEQCKDVDIIITTALIPGKPAPKLITKEMVESMKEGSVTVDLASEAGGNIETTVKNQSIKHGGVTCIGFTDFPSRLATQSSTLWANNVTKYLLSMVGSKNHFYIDLEDEVVRNSIIVKNGEKLWPAPKVESKEVKKQEKPIAPKIVIKEINPFTKTFKDVLNLSIGLSTLIGLGYVSPSLAFANMITTFSLAGFIKC
jgi:NAD(P) transhydrogenase